MTTDAIPLDRKAIARSLARTAREGTANLAVAVKAVGVAGEAADLALCFGIALHVRDLLGQRGRRRALAEAGRLYLAGHTTATAATGRDLIVRLPAVAVDPALHSVLANLGLRRNRRRNDVQEFTGSADAAVVAELVAAAGGCVTVIASPPVPEADSVILQAPKIETNSDIRPHGQEEPSGTEEQESALDPQKIRVLDRPSEEDIAGPPTRDETMAKTVDHDSDTLGDSNSSRSGGHGFVHPRDRLRPRGPSSFRTIKTHIALASEVLANRRAIQPALEPRVTTPSNSSAGPILQHDGPATIADASRFDDLT